MTEADRDNMKAIEELMFEVIKKQTANSGRRIFRG